MFLTTERLLLREFREDDWPTILTYQNNPLYLRYYEWSARTAEDVREFVQMFLVQQQEEPRLKFQFGLVLRESGQLIGSCGLRMRSANAHEADIGYELDPQHWGQGYATEAARTIIQFGFTQFQLHRISSRCIADNVGSLRVLEKLGMKQEGRLREHEYFKNRWWDTLLYAILVDKWRAQQ